METYSPTETQKQKNIKNIRLRAQGYRHNVTEDPEAHLSDGRGDGIPSSGQVMP